MALININIGSPKTLVFKLTDSNGEPLSYPVEIRLCSPTTKKFFVGSVNEDITTEEGEVAYTWDTTKMTVGNLDLEVLNVAEPETPIIVERQTDFAYANESSMDTTYTNGDIEPNA